MSEADKPNNLSEPQLPQAQTLDPEDLVGAEWWAWAQLSPAERFFQMELLWQDCIALGMTLEADPDTQSPFYDPNEPTPIPSHGRPGVRILRRAPD